MPTFNAFPDRGACAQALADELAARLRQGIADNGQATLVLSGGSSPIDLFERLALIELDWSRVTVLPSDERWVATDQPESNEAALREHLLYGPGNAARLFGLYRDKGTPDDATSQLDAELRQALIGHGRGMVVYRERFGAIAIHRAPLVNRTEMPNVISPGWRPTGHRESIDY